MEAVDLGGTRPVVLYYHNRYKKMMRSPVCVVELVWAVRVMGGNLAIGRI